MTTDPARPGPRDFEVISFDCYGTLIDWESGILAAMQPVISRHDLVSRPDEILAAYARAESAVEAGPYKPYREVLRRTFAGMAKDLGFAPQADELETLVEALPRWEPFPDTLAGLRALAAAGHKLAIISNVDDDLFAATARTLEVELHAVVTAAQARCYKPGDAIFERAFEVFGVAPGRLLHAAQSRYHDLVPGRRHGVQTVHVVRDSGRGDVGAAPSVDPLDAAEPDWSVPDLAGLVALVGA
ncbi:Haloacetate dehalogenase H-2 [Enhygromyxa salina]|uniref:Haloacetate dehalogenase H-2 n=1 Tax=Enhygromyxa salina TaxID=215803 RepID=A0A2S9XRU1_9BACT|nr:haloacid dehalogenase type II [Enhygromyxa salina]PRP95460.1 Haloacetate dehalogenase H-2 [Enhygromyxa salina]